MAAVLLLGSLVFLATVKADCNSNLPLADPDPNDDDVTVIFSDYITQISLKEGIGDIQIAVFNCADYDEPEIQNFVTGNNNDLGLVTEKDSGFWFLVVKIAQDFEVPSQRAYRFFVQVANSREEVVINLINLDDVAPYFSPADSKPCEVSETLKGPTSCHLFVYDRDGIMDDMKYTVKEMEDVSQVIELVADPDGTCGPGELDCNNVVLTIKTELEFIIKPVHSLILQVEDKGGNVGTLPYILQVKAENKEIPTITPASLTAEIDEQYSGVIDFDTPITVSDRDSVEYGQFVITLVGDESNDCHKAFDVIPNAGYRTTIVKISVVDPARLNYDEGTCNDVILKIKASELYDDTRIGEARVNIKLRDVNDESPIFESQDFFFRVDEHAEPGSYLGTVKAKDLDIFDVIHYSLTSKTYLAIDNLTGEVSVGGDFNYERQPQVIVTATAEDSNDPPHVAYAQITVDVNDINDEKPELFMPSSPTIIDENTPIGEELDVEISATDEDSEPELWFTIDWETSRAAKQGVQLDKDNFTECITIETTVDPSNARSAKAILTVAKVLDWEAFDTLYVTVSVEDRKTNENYLDKKFSKATLTITINDMNDNAPVFSDVDELRFKENSDEGQLIGVIIATDPDGIGNNEVRYFLENDLYEKEYVKINAISGELRTGKDKIDFEEITEISYVVIATDGENSEQKSITIYINDENDESPHFIGDYSAPINVLENTVEKRELIFMEATDGDASPEFNTLRYELEERYRGIFDIDPVTGEVFVPRGDSNRLDYEAARSHIVQITVRDRCNEGDICYADSSSDTTSITINLEDVNDKAPVIKNGGGVLATVSELDGQGVFIGYVTADDADSGENAKLTYTLTDVEPPKGWDLFTIQDDVATNTGTITVKKDLLNEWGSYLLTVMVQDIGNLNDTGTFTIIVNDINNNLPVFVRPDNTADIRLNIAGNIPDTALTDVNGRKIIFEAIDDLDNGLNGTIGMSYSLKGDDTAMEYLTLSHNEIWLKQEFTEDMSNRFKIVVTACDGESKDFQQCADKETFVRMKVNIQYEPTFAEPEWETSFTENKTGLGEEKGIDIKVTDRNDDEDCEEGDVCKDNIYYFIHDGNEDVFHLEKESGIISLKKELDREVVNVYVLTVVVTNFENGPQTLPGENSRLRITINVIDEIDTPPAFTKSLYAAGINTGDKSGDSLTTFTATDGDFDDKLTYRIIDGTMEVTDSSLQQWQNRDPFRIQENTLLLNFNVQDSALKGLFKFNLEVMDTGNNRDEVACQIYIITENNHVTMRFQNNATYAESRKLQMANIFTKVFDSQSNIKKVARSMDSGVPIDDKADVTAYFVDENKQEPIDKTEITRKLTDKQTYNALRDALLEEKLVLESISDPESQTTADMEGVLQTVLIVVSVVLGTLVVILFAAFFIRTRSLNRRLEALSTTKFGSQDSGLNRIGMAVPNTNQHAVEGSNPVWGNDNVSSHNFDALSQSSGDSDLIGIEENPEFSPYARNGVSNDGFTPDLEAVRRESVNPVLANGYGRRVSVNPLSAAAMSRSQSVVNPMAGGFKAEDSDFEKDSRRSSDNDMEGNTNFTFLQKMDSTQITEL
ncbi:protocadherin Fat 4-like isoform X2 [Zootermopsis nevadensis]|nr:protocadherin Fat 4-like isoform X2 [Zootermopsis nevadensis]